MNCTFCKKDLISIPQDGWFPAFVKVHKCRNHPVSVRFYSINSTIISIKLYWKNQDEYVADFKTEDPTSFPFELKKRKYLDLYFKTVFQLPFEPKFTPENIIEKSNMYMENL